LRQRFPEIQGPKKNDICYATQNRQDAVKQLSQRCDLILIVGSANSSNSRRLVEVAQATGASAFLVEDAFAVNPDWLIGKRKIGVSAGASAPETLVMRVVERLVELCQGEVISLGDDDEGVSFPLPKELAC